MQGARVWSLDLEDPICCKVTKPVLHTEPTCPWACILQQENPLQWETCAPQLESSPHFPQLEKAREQQWKSSAAKKKKEKIDPLLLLLLAFILFKITV